MFSPWNSQVNSPTTNSPCRRDVLRGGVGLEVVAVDSVLPPNLTQTIELMIIRLLSWLDSQLLKGNEQVCPPQCSPHRVLPSVPWQSLFSTFSWLFPTQPLHRQERRLSTARLRVRPTMSLLGHHHPASQPTSPAQLVCSAGFVPTTKPLMGESGLQVGRAPPCTQHQRAASAGMHS